MERSVQQEFGFVTDEPLGPHPGQSRSQAATLSVWMIFAALICLGVAMINQGPLPSEDATNQSRGYIFLINQAVAIGNLDLLILFQAFAFLGSIFLLTRVALRYHVSNVPASRSVFILVLVASLGSLPFYVAHLSANVFAAVLVIVVAALSVFSRQMTRAERAMFVVLGSVAVLMEPTGLTMLILLLPIAAIVSSATGTQGKWVGPALIGLIGLAGFVDRALAPEPANPQPNLTIRLIADGPGQAFLAQNCPGIGLATCALSTKLESLADPRSKSAETIMFDRSEQFGSYRIMPSDVQAAIADEQLTFLRQVVWDSPVKSILGFVGSTLDQTKRFDVGGVLAFDPVADGNADAIGTAVPSWLPALTAFHTLVYAVSALLAIVLTVLPQNAPPLRIRAVVAMMLAGILVNAWIGGMSAVPNSLSGARVVFLMPMGLALLLMFHMPDGGKQKA